MRAVLDANVYLAAAVAGAAGFVVTGDADLLVLRVYETVRILTPRAFLNLLGPM